MAQLRAEIDADVALAYGLNSNDMELVLADFPILDRGQPAIFGEPRSTVTRDTVLAAVCKRTTNPSTFWARRVAEARARSAYAYVPSELALGGDRIEEDGAKSHG